MNSVGVFLEKEINGEPFHKFSFLSETDNSSSSSSPSLSGEEAIDSGGGYNDPSLQARVFCPDIRLRAERMLKRKEYSSDDKLKQKECSSDDEAIIPCSTSPHINKEIVDQLDDRSNWFTCKHLVHPLSMCDNEKRNDDGSYLASGCYLCETCKEVFHKERVEAPLFIIHPSYPSLSLQLHSCSNSFHWTCIVCESGLNQIAYYCPTNKVGIHVICALKPIRIIIDHFKRHPHPLTFFPKQASLACNICGVIKEHIPTYICARCVFVVHRDCIYFPYVIRISRHHHRISFTYSLPPGNLSCGVCRRKVDNSYGAYSCNNCDEGYFVHSRCALRRDLWDGEELEGTPEEENETVEDPFKTVADGEIIHFSHEHHLKLEVSRVYDEDKYCQACVLPIYEGNYYSCVDDHCDFILHETCAKSPRKIRHQLHAHSLMLKVVTSDGYLYKDGYFGCSACKRQCNGFVYQSTADQFFWLDLRCASISEPFKYEGHEHPLFLALTPDEEEGAKCQIYHDRRYHDPRKLNCIECDDFVICFRCATLPYKAKYKHDKHFLTFRKELVATDQSHWCEACEKKIEYSGEGGFYACDEYCCTTLHVDCLLGEEPYMKHGQTISSRGEVFDILRNNTVSRPFCRGCEERCPHRVCFQLKHLTFCSRGCTGSCRRFL